MHVYLLVISDLIHHIFVCQQSATTTTPPSSCCWMTAATSRSSGRAPTACRCPWLYPSAPPPKHPSICASMHPSCLNDMWPATCGSIYPPSAVHPHAMAASAPPNQPQAASQPSQPQGLHGQFSAPGVLTNWPVTHHQTPLKPLGYTRSYLPCRIGRLVPIWQ
jgi:hypothetical protein